MTKCCGDYHYADCPLMGTPAELDDSYDDPDVYYYMDDFDPEDNEDDCHD